MDIYLLAGSIGVVAGLRTFTAPAAISWAAYGGWLPLGGSWFEFLGFAATPYVLTAFGLAELINDKLPKTPSRKALMPFLARISTGAVCGGAIAAPSGSTIFGVFAGIGGAVVGTLVGYECRLRSAKAIGNRDLPIALIEDAVAISGAAFIVCSLR